MKQIVYIFLIGILLTGCQNGESQLENDTLVTETFNSNEINSLNEFLVLVDRQVMLRTNKEDVTEAYHTLFDSLQLYMQQNERDKVPLEEEVRHEIFEVLKRDNIFDEIFVENIPIKVDLKDTIFENPEFLSSTLINRQGKYRELLKSMSTVDTVFRYVDESLDAYGDISPSLTAGIIMFSENYDFSIDRIRLFGAIFYLTREKTLQTKYEKYLKNKK